jgi:DNA invertase Pin-like site-specific DNA recombinase
MRAGHVARPNRRDRAKPERQCPTAKGRDKRPSFDAMHKDASRRKFDIIMAWSVDRLGRSLQDDI